VRRRAQTADDLLDADDRARFADLRGRGDDGATITHEELVRRLGLKKRQRKPRPARRGAAAARRR